MAKRYHRKHLHQAIAATCLAVTALPALTATPAWGVTVPTTSGLLTYTVNTASGGNPGQVILGNSGSLIVDTAANGGVVGGGTGTATAVLIPAGPVAAGTITNNGTISGNFAGIYVTSGSTAGNITNSGTISGAGTGTTAGGIVINWGSAVGTITNSGTIQGAHDGINIINNSTVEGITNQASSLIKGTNSAGISLSSSTVTGKITNAGTISGGQDGISINNSSTVGATGNVASAIENSGTISGNQHGISISNNSTINGSIVNNTGGHITGTNSAGIYVNSNSTVTGGIDNSGTISGGSYGIYIGNGSTVDSITNHAGATIQAGSPPGTAGIYLSGGTVSGSITNSGIITGQAGIYAVSNSNIGSIVNNVGAHITGTNSAGIYLSSSTVTGNITNSGIISGRQFGIMVQNNSSIGGDITNTGTIKGSTSVGIYVNNSTITGAVVNNGTIQGAGTGIRVQSSAVNGGITNSGTIQGGNYAIYITNPTSPVVITNTGLLDGAVELADGTLNLNGASGRVTGAVTGLAGSTVNVNGTFATENNFSVDTFTIANGGTLDLGNTLTASGGVTDNGTLNINGTAARITDAVSGTGTVNVNGTFATENNFSVDTFTIANGGTLDLGNTLTASGGVTDNGTLNINGTAARITDAVSGTGTVNVNGTFASESTFDVGTFNIANGGLFNMGHDVTVANGVHNSGTLSVAAGNLVTITGDYTQNASGIFQTGASSASNYGKLVVTGTADLTASNKIDVKVSSGDTLANGNVLRNVLSAGTLHAGALTVTDNSAVWNFTATVNGNAIDLTAEQGMNYTQAVSGGGAFPAAAGVAGALDAIQTAGATGDMQTVLNALGSLGTATEVGQAVSQLMPALAGNGGQIAMGVAGSSGSQVVHERMSGEHGLSSGEPLFKDRAFWVQPFYSWTDQSERKGVTGYSANSYGLAMGADGKVSEAWRLGAALSFAKGDVDGDSPITRANLDINTYQVSLYATDELSEATSLNLQAAFGLNDNDSSRDIQFGGLNRIASADYTSWHTLLDAELEHRYKVNEKTTLAPYLRAQYTYVNAEDYTETGAGAANLHVDSDSEDSLVVSAGGRAAYALTDRAKLTGHVGIGYDFLASQSSVTSTFAGGGSAFITKGLDPATVVMQGGLGFEMLAANGTTIAARYDVDGRQDYTNQVVSLKLKVPF